MNKLRTEKDSLGERKLPAAAYYGIQTLRAKENFPISGIPPRREFITATAMIKMAAAETNSALGLLSKKKGRAVMKAAAEVISGKFDREFIVDVYQAGAGTSHNMNANEVIANRAAELLRGKKGDHALIHPNDHVNMSQSTNDVIPAAMRLTILMMSNGLLETLEGLAAGLKKKARSFDRVIKSARTHLQDAVPLRLGQEFSSYGESVRRSSRGIRSSRENLKTLGIGGTAAGTGLNTHPRYRAMAVKALSRLSGIKGLKGAG
ncbi:MAG: aspartate ammonia-lyase, partial [Deltaproteobacteria bacterium]|nr:aspartate ammonia-lyase [Deltaproteobacteria bacterium]